MTQENPPQETSQEEKKEALLQEIQSIDQELSGIDEVKLQAEKDALLEKLDSKNKNLEPLNNPQQSQSENPVSKRELRQTHIEDLKKNLSMEMSQQEAQEKAKTLTTATIDAKRETYLAAHAESVKQGTDKEGFFKRALNTLGFAKKKEQVTDELTAYRAEKDTYEQTRKTITTTAAEKRAREILEKKRAAGLEDRTDQELKKIVDRYTRITKTLDAFKVKDITEAKKLNLEEEYKKVADKKQAIALENKKVTWLGKVGERYGKLSKTKRRLLGLGISTVAVGVGTGGVGLGGKAIRLGVTSAVRYVGGDWIDKKLGTVGVGGSAVGAVLSGALLGGGTGYLVGKGASYALSKLTNENKIISNKITELTRAYENGEIGVAEYDAGRADADAKKKQVEQLRKTIEKSGMILGAGVGAYEGYEHHQHEPQVKEGARANLPKTGVPQTQTNNPIDPRGQAIHEGWKIPHETTAPVQPHVIPETAYIHQGDGIENTFRRQIEADPAMAKALGYTGDVTDIKALHEFSGGAAHRLALDEGYVDRVTGEQVGARWMGDHAVAYELKADGAGKYIVQEHWTGHDDADVGLHGHNATFESANQREAYEMNGPQNHASIDHHGEVDEDAAMHSHDYDGQHAPHGIEDLPPATTHTEALPHTDESLKPLRYPEEHTTATQTTTEHSDTNQNQNYETHKMTPPVIGAYNPQQTWDGYNSGQQYWNNAMNNDMYRETYQQMQHQSFGPRYYSTDPYYGCNEQQAHVIHVMRHIARHTGHSPYDGETCGQFMYRVRPEMQQPRHYRTGNW